MKTNKLTETRTFVTNQDVTIRDGVYGIYKLVDKRLVFCPKGSAVYIEEVWDFIDDGQKVLKLCFFDAKGKKQTVEFPRKNLTEQGVLELLGRGVQVDKKTAYFLVSSIMNQEPEAEVKCYHNTLGFFRIDEKTVFLGANAIGVESTYNGNLCIGTHGSKNVWKQMVEEEVVGYTPMEFVLAVAGGGILVDYLREKVGVENLIVHLVSESSTGKSSAGYLLVSCGAKPSFTNSTIGNFSDTTNAIMASIKSSYPYLLDEGSLWKSGRNCTSFLYELSMGSERKRLTKELNTKEGAHFNTAILITSEKSLLNYADENTGLLVRNIEIENVMFTKSADSADRIKRVTQNNYGFLIPMLAQHIINLEEAGKGCVLVNRFQEICKEMIVESKEKGKYNPFTERVTKQYALIILSAELINDILGINLNIQGIKEFLECHSLVDDPARADISKRALVFLIEYVSRYYAYFQTDSSTDIQRDCRGKIRKTKSVRLATGEFSVYEVHVSEISLDEILQTGGFPEKKIILKKWKEQGYLNCEKDRFVSDIIVASGMQFKGYKIRIPEQMSGDGFIPVSDSENPFLENNRKIERRDA